MSVQLTGAVRTCYPDSGWATKWYGEHYLNPLEMACYVPTGADITGRFACLDSLYTKAPGCNSALDRVYVENAQRPQYMEYINLDAAGFKNDGTEFETVPDASYFEGQGNPSVNKHAYDAAVSKVDKSFLGMFPAWNRETYGATNARGSNFNYEISQGQEDRVKKYILTGHEAETHQHNANRAAVQAGTWGANFRERAGMGF